jgi:hypothetical protein
MARQEVADLLSGWKMATVEPTASREVTGNNHGFGVFVIQNQNRQILRAEHRAGHERAGDGDRGMGGN